MGGINSDNRFVSIKEACLEFKNITIVPSIFHTRCLNLFVGHVTFQFKVAKSVVHFLVECGLVERGRTWLSLRLN